MWIMMALAGAGTADLGPVSVELHEALLQQSDDLRSVVDRSALARVAEVSWLTTPEKMLHEHSLHPIKEEAHQLFCGLGGARRAAGA